MTFNEMINVPGSIAIRFPLSGNNVIGIYLQKKVSLEDFERIRQLIFLSKSAMMDEKLDCVVDKS